VDIYINKKPTLHYIALFYSGLRKDNFKQPLWHNSSTRNFSECRII